MDLGDRLIAVGIAPVVTELAIASVALHSSASERLAASVFTEALA